MRRVVLPRVALIALVSSALLMTMTPAQASTIPDTPESAPEPAPTWAVPSEGNDIYEIYSDQEVATSDFGGYGCVDVNDPTVVTTSSLEITDASSGDPILIPPTGKDCPLGTAYGAKCQGSIDFPHASRSVHYTINTHVVGKCKVYPQAHSIEASTYRMAWYGWNHWFSKSVSGAKRDHKINMAKSCSPNASHRYKTSARHYALIGKEKHVLSHSRANKAAQKCLRTNEARPKPS